MTLHLVAGNLEAAGLRHGFSTRRGGVSAAPFDSLNLARVGGDAPEAVDENHRRLAGSIGYDLDRLYEVTQVHGARVLTVTGVEVPAVLRAEEADGLASRTPGVALGVRVADCLPVLLADPEARVVGAAHAGWRGVEGGVVARTLEAMVALGARPQRTLAALGPHIGECCFEVGPEVAQRIADAAPGASVITGDAPHPRVDLAGAVCAQLSTLGLDGARVERVPGCTRCDPARRFFSYRGEHGHTGRLLSAIVCPADG